MKTTSFICALLFFWQEPANTLEDTHWSLVQIQEGAVKQLADTSCGISLHFDTHGNYRGYSGWNKYNGRYSTGAGNELMMNYPVRTKRGGEARCQLGESLYDHFERASNYTIHADTVFLWTADSTKITFKRQ